MEPEATVPVRPLSGDCLAIVQVLRSHPHGMTTWPLMIASECCNLTGRVSDLRRLGYRIVALRQRKRSARGKTVFKYRLLGEPESKGGAANG